MLESLLFVLVYFPVISGAGCALFRSPRAILMGSFLSVLVSFLIAVHLCVAVFSGDVVRSARNWLFLDELSAFHLVIMTLVFLLSSLFAMGYYREEVRAGKLKLRQIRQHTVLWSGSLTAMTLVLLSNNLGLMWVGIEGTTLLTAFLISLHRTKPSLEAKWKYLIICSVGVGMAFIGTIFVGSAATTLRLGFQEAMMWSELLKSASSLNPVFMKVAFLFALVGYGTKVGLAPMHNWLPDAHSQAPSPVSAMFSGFMLSTAMYCLMRYVPLVEGATGNVGWSLELLRFFGMVSILVAAAFIVLQHDLKRLLAYCSVEHLGIIALGVGLGGLGTFAALYHTLNHSISKSFSFFAAGRLGQIYHSHDMDKMHQAIKVSPVWGIGILSSLLSLVGMAPFAVFMSKLQIMRAAISGGYYYSFAVFVFGSVIIFISILRDAISIVWGVEERSLETIENELHGVAIDESHEGAKSHDKGRIKAIRGQMWEWGLVVVCISLLLVLGLYLPKELMDGMNRAAKIVGGGF